MAGMLPNHKDRINAPLAELERQWLMFRMRSEVDIFVNNCNMNLDQVQTAMTALPSGPVCAHRPCILGPRPPALLRSYAIHSSHRRHAISSGGGSRSEPERRKSVEHRTEYTWNAVTGTGAFGFLRVHRQKR